MKNNKSIKNRIIIFIASILVVFTLICVYMMNKEDNKNDDLIANEKVSEIKLEDNLE